MEDPIWRILILVLFAAVIVEGFLLVGIMRQLGSVLLRLSPARPGEIEGGPEQGARLEVPGLELGKPSVVVFVAPGCSLCDALQPGMSSLKHSYPELQVIAVPWADDEEERMFYALKLGDIARPDLHDLAHEWDVRGTPYAVGLDAESKVRKAGIVNTLDHLEALAETVLGVPESDESNNEGLSIGFLQSEASNGKGRDREPAQ